MVLTSHSLRTLHRVVAPYHGLPGKHAALRTVFAAAALTQARALVVLDPAGPATSPERVTELITPITRAEVEFLAPRYRRHPRDGPLVTQLARPLVRSRLRRRARRTARRRVLVLGTVRIALPRPGHLGSGGGAIRDRSVAAGRSHRRRVRARPDLAADHRVGRRARQPPRGGAAGHSGADREPARARVLLGQGRWREWRLRTWGDEPATRARRAVVGLRGPGGAGPPGHHARSGRCSTASSTPTSSPASWRTCRRPACPAGR